MTNSASKDETDVIRMKLKNGSINDIEDVYYTQFHKIKHTESFAILIHRLEEEMKRNKELQERTRIFKVEVAKLLYDM